MESPAAFDDDLNGLSLIALARLRQPLFLPWSKERLAIGTAFDSSKLPEGNPWLGSPFLRDRSGLIQCEIQGGTSTYNDATSSSASQTSEHLSASLGLTVGCKWLNANATCHFDKMVLGTGHDVKVSRIATYRVGKVAYCDSPELDIQSSTILTRQDGISMFRKLYGDYYVGGYQLGADVGVCMAVASGSSSITVKKSVTVKAKALFWEAEAETAVTVDQDYASDLNVQICAYDTMTQDAITLQTKADGESSNIRRTTDDYLERASTLQANVSRRLVASDLHHERFLTWEDSEKICASGLVIQLILLPFSALTAYVALTSSSGMILEDHTA